MGQHPQSLGSGSRQMMHALMPSAGFPLLAGLADLQWQDGAGKSPVAAAGQGRTAQVSLELLLTAEATLHWPVPAEPAA